MDEGEEVCDGCTTVYRLPCPIYMTYRGRSQGTTGKNAPVRWNFGKSARFATGRQRSRVAVPGLKMQNPSYRRFRGLPVEVTGARTGQFPSSRRRFSTRVSEIRRPGPIMRLFSTTSGCPPAHHGSLDGTPCSRHASRPSPRTASTSRPHKKRGSRHRARSLSLQLLTYRPADQAAFGTLNSSDTRLKYRFPSLSTAMRS